MKNPNPEFYAHPNESPVDLSGREGYDGDEAINITAEDMDKLAQAAEERLQRESAAAAAALRADIEYAADADRNDFYEEVPTLEEGITVGLSQSSYGEGDGYCGLLQLSQVGKKDLLCVYLSDDQLEQLRDTITKYLALPPEHDSAEDDDDEWDEFTSKYTPVKNHLDDNASGDGFMFETYGAEYEFVKAADSRCIWTLIDCDGKSFIAQGWHWVNRMGYFITVEPVKDEDLGRDYRY